MFLRVDPLALADARLSTSFLLPQKPKDILETLPNHDALFPRRGMLPCASMSLNHPEPAHLSQGRLQLLPPVHRHELILGTLTKDNEPRRLVFSHPYGNFRRIEARRARCWPFALVCSRRARQ